MSELDAVQAALARGNYEQAADLASIALDQGLRHPTFYNVLAFRHSEAGRYDEALALLRRGFEIAPRDAHLLYSIGFCLFQLGRNDEALIAFDAALAVKPGFPAPLHHKGMILERRGDEAQAMRCYEMAIRSDPNYEDPYAGLASVAAGRGDFARARGHARRALALAPRQPTAHLAIARADFDEGRFEAVEARLKPLLAIHGFAPIERPGFLGLLGDALDALDRPEEAFAAWTEGKRLSFEQFANTSIAATAQRHLDRIRLLTPFVETLAPFRPAARGEPPAAGLPRQHVFLVGFPRSGTTLLEQVLASHGDVVALEERPLLELAELEFLVSPASFQRLLDAGDELLDPFRELYWRQLETLGVKVAGAVFVDKLPLGSLLIPLIARLFPSARILFAERDPRDVVLGCFRRAFGMNPGMFQFVTLDGTARFYDLAMGLADRYRRLVPGRIQAVRYELLVRDFERQCREVCDFIGLDWNASLNDFSQTAKFRRIRTPSAPQVRKGLYASAAGHWRRYAEHMAPVLPVLEPWVAALGYEPTKGAVSP
ncbi:MAG: sulfotransferase family protein [Caulobacteraceae bacterium]|nr:sulfotransferase family protein [Caulobacteraceae bacterium]